MQAETRRVALLARPGAAHDRLRVLLDEAGVACVLDADPTVTGVGALVDSNPDVVLVALDSPTEDVLERFDAVMANASVDVIFEEAESVVSRQGWDAARWQRHLIAKLQRHDDVLPPAPFVEDGPPHSIALPDDDSVSLADLAAEFARAPDVAVELAVAEAVAEAAGHASNDALLAGIDGVAEVPALTLSDDMAGAGLGVRTPEDSHALDSSPVDPFVGASFTSLEFESESGQPGSTGNPFDPVSAETLEWGATDAAVALETSDFDPVAFDATVFDPAGFDASAFDTSGFDSPLFGEAPPALGTGDTFASRGPVSGQFEEEVDAAQFEAGIDASATGQASVPASGPDASRFGGLELTLDDGSVSHTPDSNAASGRFRHDLDDLHARISTMELVDDTPRSGPDQTRGAVLVMAGIGGPDAVRQLLGALPMEFPRAVLVQQRLEGGRYDKLVAQMQRATSLPVQLAEPGAMALGGTVYILSDAVGIESQGETIRFTSDVGNVLATLPASDSAVLMFSGSDATLVDAAMKHSWSGALVAGQSPDGCYDPTAPAALVARGADVGQPAELARLLAARWTH